MDEEVEINIEHHDKASSIFGDIGNHIHRLLEETFEDVPPGAYCYSLGGTRPYHKVIDQEGRPLGVHYGPDAEPGGTSMEPEMAEEEEAPRGGMDAALSFSNPNRWEVL
jgi:hypothetical protein